MFLFSCVYAVVKKIFAIHGIRINYNRNIDQFTTTEQQV